MIGCGCGSCTMRLSMARQHGRRFYSILRSKQQLQLQPNAALDYWNCRRRRDAGGSVMFNHRHYYNNNSNNNNRFTTTTSTTTPFTIGILRETYDRWERRAPLSPHHVRLLLQKYNSANSATTPTAPTTSSSTTAVVTFDTTSTIPNEREQQPPKVQVLVQPATHRIFLDQEYQTAGAVITNDLTSAHCILGVKRPLPSDKGQLLHTQQQQLLHHKTYMFFSHVIKGQPNGMALLQQVLDKKIQLIDYECIVEEEKDGQQQPPTPHEQPISTTTSTTRTTPTLVTTGEGAAGTALAATTTPPAVVSTTTQQHHRRPKRLAAFGKFAGMAGMMSTLQAIGRRLLLHGYSTPFLQCPPAYMHTTLEDAKDTIRRVVGPAALNQQHGSCPILPEPLVIAITGKGGKVYCGVMEILQLLPHQIVSVDDLPHVMNSTRNHVDVGQAAATAQFPIYVVPLSPCDIYQKQSSNRELQSHNNSNGPVGLFDRADFEQSPSTYTSTFHERVAPYAHVLVNCMYWDDRYPRLITKEQIKHLYENGNRRLMIVSDISCDLKGSIEFLERTTTIERPYFQYDPFLGKEVADDITDAGITVMGVDILPTELARESTEHFGDAVMGVLEELIDAVVGRTPLSDKTNIDFALLPPKLKKACITSDGSLTPNFQYLKQTSYVTPSPTLKTSMDLLLDGHLFDSGLINQVLDIVELQGCNWEFLQCSADSGTTTAKPPSSAPSAKSKALLRIRAMDASVLSVVQSKIETLIRVIEKADASVLRHDWVFNPPSFVAVGEQRAVVQTKKVENVLLLGSGMVSKSVVQYLARARSRSIVVASENENEARSVAAVAGAEGVARHVGLDIENDSNLSLPQLVQQADVVISLLPAPLHPKVAECCIKHGRHLVTASYESDAMRQLHDRAIAAGVLILNEVGLDPGLDHMSALRIFDDIRKRGGSICSFRSVCGGLPSPECKPNPLMYKFSWSPRGVLRACQNDASFRQDGDTIEIYGKELLSTASPFLDAWPALQLECLPNRDSLSYLTKYGIESARTVFRGTLRYRGFSTVMNVFQNMGLFENVEIGTEATTWDGVFDLLRRKRGGFNNLDDFILACAEDDAEIAFKAKQAFKWLGMTDEGEQPKGRFVVDTLCHALETHLQYEENERDMVLMHHSIEAEYEDGTVERHTSSLQAFGEPGMSAMSKTVGYTTAAATELILDGSLREYSGLALPTTEAYYGPILQAAHNEGIRFVEFKEIISAPSKATGTR